MSIMLFSRRSSLGASKFSWSANHSLWILWFVVLDFIETIFRKHKDDAPEEENFNEKKSADNSLPKWDSEFLKVDQGTLFGTESFSVSTFFHPI